MLHEGKKFHAITFIRERVVQERAAKAQYSPDSMIPLKQGLVTLQRPPILRRTPQNAEPSSLGPLQPFILCIILVAAVTIPGRNQQVICPDPGAV